MEDLLSHLNTVLGTSHALDMPGLRPCLEHALHTSHDFGQLYGTLRSWWSEDFTQTLDRMKRLGDEVRVKRGSAIHGSCIQDCEIPPRRVWDLRSNRVLPYHVIVQAEAALQCIEWKLWTVSHSWVDAKECERVMTAINGWQWPVPIPRKTSLDHIRIELLNMGAEYVWLDVLCLRQEGGVDEDRRLEEWQLDVPTIGHIYQAYPCYRPCITYFNGLGLPLDTSLATCESPRHWSKRVWTLQEALDSWLPGGLTADSLAVDSPMLFDELHSVLSGITTERKEKDLDGVFQAVRNRHCTTELDRVAGVAYHLGCETLPLYDRTISIESAWDLLIKHVNRWYRTDFFLQYASETPFGLWISWKGLLTSSQPALPTCTTEVLAKLNLESSAQLSTNEPGQYDHWGYALGPCSITRSADMFHLQFTDTNSVTMHVSAEHGIFLPAVAYTLLGLNGPDGKQYWVVMEVVGEQRVREHTLVEAIKWGVLYVDSTEACRLENLDLRGHEDIRVIYLSSEEALARSKHVNEYMKAFREARASDGKVKSAAA